MAKPGVMIYHTMIPLIEMLSPSEAGELLLAILQYSATGTYNPLPRTVDLLMQSYIPQIDRDAARYEKVSETRRRAAEKRWRESAQASDEAEPASEDFDADPV